jgi:hypothetical protein
MITDNTTKAGLMSPMEAVLSDTSQVWLTSYFGFTPADWGFFSFTDKGRRDTVVEQNLSKSVPVSSGMKQISTRHFKPVQTHNFTPRHARCMGGGWSVFRGRNDFTLCPAPYGFNHKDYPMIDDQFYSGKTQVFWVCDVLLKQRTITHQTEIKDVRGWRLGAIIHRLIHDNGWPIHAEYRGSHNVAHYSLKAEVDRAAIRFPPSARSLAKQEEVQ